MQVIQKTMVRAGGDDPLEYVMSDETVDRYGDVIDVKGWQLGNFKNNPIALFGHDSDFIVGKWVNVRVEGGKLKGKLELLRAGISARLDEIRAAVEAGVLRAVSVGFRPLAEPEMRDGGRGAIYRKQELVECSLVSIPANPNALAVAKSLHLSPKASALIFGEPAAELMRKGLLPGEPADLPSQSNQRGRQMSLAQKIEAAEQRLVTLMDQRIEEINKDDSNVEVVEGLNEEVDKINRSLDALRKAEQQSFTRSAPVGVQTAAGAPSAPAFIRAQTKSVKPENYVYRAIACKLLARAEQKNVDQVLVERYGDDRETREVMNIVTKASTVPATTTLTGWAAELVQTSIGDFIDSLMPLSVYPGLAARGGKFTFGRNGVISLPSRAATPTIGGSFIAQGAPIPVRQAAFAATTLTPKKMGVISTFTREIAEHSTPSIEALIRQAIQEDTAVAIDSVLLDATAASTTRPAGLRNGVTVTTATTGGGFAAVVGDLKNLIGVLAAANSLRAPVWLINPAQALSISLTQNAGGDFPFAEQINNGTLQGFPVLQSTSMPAGTVILLDAADFFSATGDEPRFDVNDTATVHMEDTTPLAIGTAGSPNTVAAPVRSLWQTDTLGIRMLLDINWAMRRSGVIAWTSSVTW
jgi:HK97 family phage major capsid protein/HK97 family phage prohead protease